MINQQVLFCDTRVCPGAHETCSELERLKSAHVLPCSDRPLTCNRDQPTPERGKRVGEMPSSLLCSANPQDSSLGRGKCPTSAAISLDSSTLLSDAKTSDRTQSVRITNRNTARFIHMSPTGTSSQGPGRSPPQRRE